MAQEQLNKDKQFGKDSYWLQRDAKDAIDYLEDVHVRWSLWNTSPVRISWVRNFTAYYSAMINPSSWDTSLIWEGVQGELIKMFSPKARTLMRQLITLLTKQRLAFQAQAQSSGIEILKDVKLANAIMDQVIQEECLNKKEDDILENALVFGAGFTHVSWRTDLGEPYIVDEGRIIRTGKATVDIYSPLDVFYEVDIASWDRQAWAEVRTIKNRWDLIAEHPEIREELLKIPSWYDVRGPNYWFDQQNVMNNDLVAVYELYAKPSPAVPQGRMLIYCTSECVLYDGPNIYGCIPIEQLIPERIQGTSLGYSKLTDIMASQEMWDNTISAIATNQSQFAVQSVTVPRGSNINVQELNGMRYVSFTPMDVQGGGRPEPLQLTQSPPECFKFLDILGKNMDDFSNIHPIMRGDTKGVTSGAMAATMTANAIETIDSLSKVLFDTMERTMMHVVNAYKMFAKIPQQVSMNGKANQIYTQEFVGEDVKNICGVKIMVSNPMLQTIAGRLEIANSLMQMPPELWGKYTAILDGHPLDTITKHSLSQEDLIKMENSELLYGRPVITLITDDHAAHIYEHSSLLNDPEVRRDPAKTQEIMNHIMEHNDMMYQAPQELMQIIKTGQAPMMQPGMEQPGMGQQEMPTGLDNQIPQGAEPAPDPLGRATMATPV